MTKKYTKDMTVEEVIDRLQKGEVIYDETDPSSKLRMVNGVLVKYIGMGYIINYGLGSGVLDCYFEDTEPFQITETGLYKTRDGRKAFICSIGGTIVRGVIEDFATLYTWEIHTGVVHTTNNSFDLVSKWEE